MQRTTVREYAAVEGISLGAAYVRIWSRRVRAVKQNGRWFVLPEAPDTGATPGRNGKAEPANTSTSSAQTFPGLGDLTPDRSYVE